MELKWLLFHSYLSLRGMIPAKTALNIVEHAFLVQMSSVQAESGALGRHYRVERRNGSSPRHSSALHQVQFWIVIQIYGYGYIDIYI